MSLALRYGACGSFFLATVLIGASLFLPTEHIDPTYGGRVEAGAWGAGGGLQDKNGTATKAGSWYSPQFSEADGLTFLRMAGPMIILGTLVLAICGFMVLSGRGIRTGWTGTVGLSLAGLGALFLLLGIGSFARSIGRINEVLDQGIGPEVGFWAIFTGLLVGCGAALASFNVKPERRGRIGPDGEPLPPLPILSVENPSAFNPMANRDPKPFRQEDFGYKTFEVTGGPRTFKSGDAKEPEEGSWEALEQAPPKAPPKPAAPAASKPAASPSPPSPKGAAPPAGSAATPAAAKPAAAPSKASPPASAPKADKPKA